MAVVGILTIFFSSSLLFLLFHLTKFLHKVWWTPRHIQRLLSSQGVKGISYSFPHGNTKVISAMRSQSMGYPMGISHDMFPRIHPHVYLWAKIYGRNFINWHGPEAQLFVTEPEFIEEILNNKEDAYLKMEVEGYSKKLLGEALITNEGERWAKIRKLANHTFHANSLEGMIPEMSSSVETMLERWRDYEGKEIDVYKEFEALTTEVISITAFGSNFSNGKHIFEMVAKLTAITVRNIYKTRFQGLSQISRTDDEIEAEKLEQGIKNSILDIANVRDQKVKNREADDLGSDYLGQLIKIAHESDEKKRNTIGQLGDEIKALYGAGHLTTTNLLSWTVFLLAVHTDWQEKAREEVIAQFGRENPSSDGIARLESMDMIINESLRLYPPVSSITRTVKKEVELGNLTLPPNLNIFISILALHHNPQIWGKDVHLFKPERFAEGVAKAANNNGAAFVPFGMGPRTCVGLNLAGNESKIALSMLLRRYKFSLSPNYVHHPVDILFLTPKDGVKIILQKL